MEGVFFKSNDQYNNQLNPVKGYLEQLTNYIAVKKNIPVDQAKEKAIIVIKKHFKDRPIKYFERQENGDRVVKDGTLLGYIKENIANKNILVPTFTSYMNSSVKKSILSEFISVNVKRRSIAKKAGQKAKAEGDMELADAKNDEQNNLKTYNNSLSGVFGQEACILCNPTAHNTLTSITRTITSLSNASNEKLIAGNRYLPRGIDVLNSIVYISTYVDSDTIKSVIDQYGLHIPTVEETVSVLKYSSDNYFIDNIYYQNKIIPFLKNLSPYKLAAICYCGDLYHIRKYNDQFMRVVFDELLLPINADGEKMDNVSIIHSVDESILNFVHNVFFSKVKGYGKDYDKMNESGIASSIYKTCLHVKDVLLKYKSFFNVFFMTELFPTNSFRLKNLRRRTVVLSDTDSTCFTLDEWVRWYRKDFFIDDNSIALAGSISYIASQAIVNQLAILSNNMNIEKELLNTLAMKNEFLWTVHVPANVSKHYFAYTVMQEGNVFKEADIEVKGVGLKSSAVPINIIKDGKDLMNHILSTIHNNKKIKLNDIVARIKKIENDITESVKKGESIYLRKSKVKGKEAYSQDEFKSPYQRHVFWKRVFAPKYGDIIDPPYDVIKIPTTVKGSTALKKWLEIIEDEALKARLIEWLTEYNKKDLPTVYLNDTYVLGNGIPKEIIDVIDLKRIILDTTLQHRTILETLGVMLREDKLVSEQFM